MPHHQESAGGPLETLDPGLYLGTSSWSCKDWEGLLYPRGTAPGDYLACYAQRFRAVEVDATFYRAPSLATTRRWRQVLPDGFVMAAKVPQIITHEKRLEGCDAEMEEFLAAMEPLGDRLGPLLLQFPYHAKASGVSPGSFLDRLGAFLAKLPATRRFAVEVRNRTWLRPPLLGLLRRHGVALALIDHPWMPRPEELFSAMDPVTADFVYVRWLGDRLGIEKQTTRWDRPIVNRSREMAAWVPAIRSLLARGLNVYGFFNNHYAGHAPASIELFEQTWRSAAGPP